MTIDSANRYGLVSAFIHKYFDGGYKGCGSELESPIGTITSRDHNSLCAAYITKLKGQNLGQPMDTPLQTITAGGNHLGKCAPS
jgi:DNA (cytosine-5)-methyltransferase 1